MCPICKAGFKSWETITPRSRHDRTVEVVIVLGQCSKYNIYQLILLAAKVDNKSNKENYHFRFEQKLWYFDICQRLSVVVC